LIADNQRWFACCKLRTHFLDFRRLLLERPREILHLLLLFRQGQLQLSEGCLFPLLKY
jgi:hypothetical protein